MEFADDVLKRFWSKTETSPELSFNGTPCRLWTGAVYNQSDRNKYGRFTTREQIGKSQWWLAHRFSYTVYVGVIAEGLEVDHLCRRTLCVEPAHLEAVTGCENRRRAERFRLYQVTCPKGHLLVPHHRKGTTPLVCRRCVRDRTAAYLVARDEEPMPARSIEDLTPTCRNGHTRTRDNTRFDKRGLVKCRACAKEATERWKAKQTDAA